MKIKIEGLVGSRLELTSGYAKFGKELQRLLPVDDKSDARLWISPPYDRELPKGFNAIFTMHELSELPENKKNWVNNLNKYNLIIVPTSWNRSVFYREGVKTPIEVAPLGVDTEIFKPLKNDVFSMLTMHDNFGRESSRENWLQTLEVYMEYFRPIKDCRLTIKTWNYKKGMLETTLDDLCQKLHIHKNNAPKIEIADFKIEDGDLSNYYSFFHLFIKNANREGWSMPLNETIACGLDVIFSDIPGLQWAKPYGDSFKNKEEMASLMLTRYIKWKKNKLAIEKFNSKTTAKLVLIYMEKYYGKKG